ncbi:MAG: hypothetical protein K6F50_02680 [Kiritimatiellae bacterium]|nr:hypothetical protein [Kiritimatiellia bacterium]
MFFSESAARGFFSLLAAAAVFSSFAEVKSVRMELSEMIAAQGKTSGVDLARKRIVAIGVAHGKSQPEFIARAAAVCEICGAFNGSVISAFRSAAYDGGAGRSSVETCISKVTKGEVVGVREIARVVREGETGAETTVGVAIEWSLKQEIAARTALDAPPSGLDGVEEGVRSIPNLERLSGPQIWYADNGEVRFLGVAAAEVKGSGPKALLNAKRIARMRAQRNLADHFACYNPGGATHFKKETVSSAMDRSKEESVFSDKLDESILVKKRVKLSSGLGVQEIFEDVREVDGRKIALCVCCLMGSASVSGP